MDNNSLNGFNGKSKEEFLHIIDFTMTAVMGIEFVLVLGIYLMLKSWVSGFAAECWLVGMFALALKSSVDTLAPKFKNDMLKRFGYEKHIEEDCSEEPRQQAN